MKFTRLLSGVALAGMLAATATAQPAAPSPEKIAPEKLAMAKQMVDLSGGTKQVNALMAVIYKSVGDTMGANLPPEQQRLRTVLVQKMQERTAALVPQMIDVMVQVYARDLTDKELRDSVTWMQSETAQSVNRKLPQITAEAMQSLTPAMTQVTEGLKQDVLDAVCKEANCTASDREALAAAMAKGMPKRPG